MRSSSLFGLVILTVSASMADADVKPNGLFTAGAVLQRERPVPIWGTGSEGERVSVTIGERRAVTVSRNGRWSVFLPPLAAGGPYTLTIAGHNRIVLRDVLVGDVYLCSGQSNMEWPLSLARNGAEAVSDARDPQLHLFSVPKSVSDEPLTDMSGMWQPCTPESARGFSATAYFFGRSLRKHLGVPIGLIQSTWSGTPAEAWTSRATLASIPMLSPLLAAHDAEKAAYRKALADFERTREADTRPADAAPPEGAPLKASPKPPVDSTDKNSPTALYNSMIAPLAPYAIRGVVLYQGEANVGAAFQYQTLFPALIANWRADWHEEDMPFLFVQIAPFLRRQETPGDSAWAELREAQRLTSRTVQNTGMAVITDLGDETDIHPRDKQPVGERLALLARSLVYGEEVEAYGPVYDSARVEDDHIVVHFLHANGLRAAEGGALRGFTIAGEDGIFVNAAAVVHGDSVTVSSPQTPHPIAVRYGWADYPEGNLWNAAGLPASPFRTDKFPLTTENK